MRPAGLEAFSKKRENRVRHLLLRTAAGRRFPSHTGARLPPIPRAAEFLAAQPPSYRKLVTWWIVSAKKEETRLSRLDKLVAACHAGKRL